MSWLSDRHHNEGLSDLPAWGLEIMMGLYGPSTISAALESERKSIIGTMDRSVAALSAVGFVPVYLPPSTTTETTETPEPGPRPEKAVPVGELGGAGIGPAMAEFIAVDALGRRLARLFHRH